ncbi:MAG: ArsA-related P-loop ATPase [Candidatus Bathyarchaeota archaeon]
MAIIVFSGKGGTGKTSLSALSIRYFSEKDEVTLALDLDPDSHLYKLLGTPLKNTVGQMVDRMHKEKKVELEPKKPVDLSDQEYLLSLVTQEVIVEDEKHDLLTLGKPSADVDCYCPVFLWSEYAISQVMKSYGTTYKNIVVDCDPGTELFPRKILNEIANHSIIDHIILVLDGSKMSLDTAADIIKEVKGRKLDVKNISGICVRVDNTNVQKQIEETARNNYGIKVVGFIPTDPEISKKSLTDQSIFTIPNSQAYEATKNIMRTLHL